MVTAVAMIERWALGTESYYEPLVEIHQHANYRETRPILSDVHRWCIRGDTAPIDIETALQIRALCNQQHGPAYSFLALDPFDYIATDASLGTGDGSNKVFRLRKPYTYGGGTPYYHPITHIVSGTLVVKLDGVTTSAYTQSNGVVTFTSAPANGVAVTASFQFYHPCRFSGNGPVRLIYEGTQAAPLARVSGLELFEVFGE